MGRTLDLQPRCRRMRDQSPAPRQRRDQPRATRNLFHVMAPSAQLGPPSSVEPTVSPGPAEQVAVQRGRDPATRPGNNPEMGCESRDD